MTTCLPARQAPLKKRLPPYPYASARLGVRRACPGRHGDYVSVFRARAEAEFVNLFKQSGSPLGFVAARWVSYG